MKGKQVLKLWGKLSSLMLFVGVVIVLAFYSIFLLHPNREYKANRLLFETYWHEFGVQMIVLVVLLLLTLALLIAVLYVHAENKQARGKVAEQNETEQMRKDFTANVSHELKTPLTSISGYAEMIENGMVREDDIPAFAGKIHAEAGRMITLIGDIIKLSELDEPNAMMETETTELKGLATDTVELLAFQAQRRGIAVRVEGESAVVEGSRTLLEELIYNLCDNSIRYNTPNGEVVVLVGIENGHPFISVEDTGIGISEKHQKRIFERFYRVDKSRSRETGGTGLGLAIVKHIAEQHKATISLQSEECVGTKIRVTFPREKS